MSHFSSKLSMEDISEFSYAFAPTLATAAKQARLDIAKMIDETRRDWDERTCTGIVEAIRLAAQPSTQTKEEGK